MDKIDRSRLSRDELFQLEQWEHATEQTKKLEKLVDLTDKLVSSVSSSNNQKTTDKLLGSIKNELTAIKGKEMPKMPEMPVMPDHATPVVKAIKALEVELSKNIKESTPTVNVKAPKVEVSPPQVNVDLDGVSDAIKEIKFDPPKAVGTDTSTLYDGQTALIPQFAPISALEKGYNEVISGVEGKSIRVVSCFVMSGDHATISFYSGEGGISLSGEIDLKPTTGFVLPKNEYGWMQTLPGDPLIIQQNQPGSLGGMLTYIEV